MRLRRGDFNPRLFSLYCGHITSEKVMLDQSIQCFSEKIMAQAKKLKRGWRWRSDGRGQSLAGHWNATLFPKLWQNGYSLLAGSCGTDL